LILPISTEKAPPKKISKKKITKFFKKKSVVRKEKNVEFGGFVMKLFSLFIVHSPK